MKYAVVLCDGMADLSVPGLGGNTPMECALKPNMDALARQGEVGLVRTVGDGLAPGSDVANLSVLGYDPRIYYSGRSSLEAVSMGIELGDSDVAIRCNLVTLSDDSDYDNKIMLDYCGGDISTQEAAVLIGAVNEALGNDAFSFHPGIFYRHCLVWHGGKTGIALTPPHDISGQAVGAHLSDHPDAAVLIGMMKASWDILSAHPVNIKRVSEGKKPANSIWLWGQGTAPRLDLFFDKFGKKGAVVSAVDLVRGIGKCAGMRVCMVDGATGYIDTNFEGKTKAALDALSSGDDFVFIHVEAPDECGHRGETQNKIMSIELIDSRVIAPLLEGLRAMGDFRIMVLPDHPTPLCCRTHTADPVPYLIYDSRAGKDSGVSTFSEAAAESSGILIDPGHQLMPRFLS